MGALRPPNSWHWAELAVFLGCILKSLCFWAPAKGGSGVPPVGPRVKCLPARQACRLGLVRRGSLGGSPFSLLSASCTVGEQFPCAMAPAPRNREPRPLLLLEVQVLGPSTEERRGRQSGVFGVCAPLLPRVKAVSLRARGGRAAVRCVEMGKFTETEQRAQSAASRGDGLAARPAVCGRGSGQSVLEGEMSTQGWRRLSVGCAWGGAWHLLPPRVRKKPSCFCWEH